MNHLDPQLSNLGDRLRAATRDDLRRRRRRRRVTRLAVAPLAALSLSGVAYAVVNELGEPAPPAVQQQFADDRTTPPSSPDPELPGPDAPLYEVGSARGSTLYATENATGFCTVVSYPETVGERVNDGYSCQPNRSYEPGTVLLQRLGGSWDAATNLVTGLVREPARTVTIEFFNGDRVVADVGRGGYFIVGAPDSTLRSDLAPVASATARDGDGEVVARSEYPRLRRDADGRIVPSP